MTKKAWLWAKNTELWIVLAQIYTMFLCLFILKTQLWGFHGADKVVAVIGLALLIALMFRYELYKTLGCKLYLLFMAFTCISGFVAEATVKKIFGSPIQRSWYMYLTALAVGYILKEKKKNRWIYVMCMIESALLAVIFPISIYGATQKLLDPEYVTLKGFGYFISGRLGTFMSPNTAGPAATVLILLSILLIQRSREMRLRGLAYAAYSLFIIIGGISLGLSRSRGAIAAAGVGIGVYFFILVYDRLKEKKAKAFLAGVGACIVAMALSVALLLVVKPAYDKAMKAYVKVYDPAAYERINDSLEVYGITYSIENLTDRTEIWSATIRMLNEKPERWIWGVTSQRILQSPILDVYDNRPEISATTAHSGYLEQLYVFGIPGSFILAVIMCVWITRAVRTVFSQSTATKEKTMTILMAAAFVNAFLEAFLFPYHILYPISFFFFVAEGCVEGTMDNKTKSTKKKIIVLVCFLIAATAVALLTAHVYRKSKDEYNKVEPITVKEQSPDDYVRLNNGISKEMMSPDYWTQLRISEGADPAKERLSLGEIERFNSINRRMIVTNTTSFSLKEIDEVFYFKVAKSLVKDVMLTVTNPEDYFVDGVPTDRAFWDDLTLNANVDAITERINVKFGVSVSRTILKRYPTDKRAFEKDSSFYYDELAQSDLLPFIPVAVLHESADSEWYYVLTYGYGGWIRKEHIALCESKEEWISRFEPEDFLVVTGRELRIPTDPYTDSLSDISVPMGTKLPVVSIEDAPEDIHGRISFGNYVAKVPFRNEDGMAEDTYVLIPMTEDVSLGYLPYTEENVAKLAFKHLGAGYGWAGDNNGQDCSGYTREIYACFGYVFPRATVAQVGMECSGSYDVSDKGYKEKMEILENAPIGTLLYFPGHIMIYLDNEEGRPYCISSVGNFATCDMDVGEISEVNTVIITDMIDTTRADGKSWLESVTQIVIP